MALHFRAVTSTALAACLLSSATPAAAQISPALEQTVQRLEADLGARGFELLRGQWHLFGIDDCRYAIASMGFCMGNNPAAPYLISTVPHWGNEFADEHLRDLLGPTTEDNWWTYRLDEREALIVLGRLPPSAAYFSLLTYAFTREGLPDITQPLYPVLTDPFMRDMVFLTSPNPSRAMVFASLGESINNVVIQRLSGAAFDQERFFIITADGVMERELTDALVQAGVADPNQIFAERISNEVARIGLDRGADDFMTIIRYAHPDDLAAGNLWRQEIPLMVLRVRDTNGDRPAEPYPAQARELRVGISEQGHAADVANLVQAVKAQWNQPAATEGQFQSLLLMIDLLGEHCLLRTRDCLGDNSDADYQISPTASLDAGEVLAVVGTLGTETGNATYVSLSVNWIPPLQGVLDVSNFQLRGSASTFAAAVNGVDNLYVQYFARDCGALANCLEVTEEMVPRGGSLKIVQRNYVVPGSTRGPDPSLLVNPVLIVLDGATRPAGG